MQLIQVFPFETAPRYLIRDSNGIYGEQVRKTLAMLGTKEKVIAYRSPWQNGYAERFGGSLRRECLDHVIIFNERHLRQVLKEYIVYHHRSRTHLGLFVLILTIARSMKSSLFTMIAIILLTTSFFVVGLELLLNRFSAGRWSIAWSSVTFACAMPVAMISLYLRRRLRSRQEEIRKVLHL